jgi:hypothetical protein
MVACQLWSRACVGAQALPCEIGAGLPPTRCDTIRAGQVHRLAVKRSYPAASCWRTTRRTDHRSQSLAQPVGADLAFLPGCYSAETSPRLADEAMHITSASRVAGYGSAIGTLARHRLRRQPGRCELLPLPDQQRHLGAGHVRCRRRPPSGHADVNCLALAGGRANALRRDLIICYAQGLDHRAIFGITCRPVGY